ncbi:Protein 21.1 [Giardia lamblia P15]|uniref:Protein 21.1 n=1 Tax=Giardia intestinalis (strain P15) TaxID=658858 RepID=E1F4E1_GIAIA|nr:Protein 21.1 [Giardia lamblia P15]
MKIQNYLQWFRACEVGDIDAIVEALPAYAKRKNSRGDTALILACKRGDRRITKLLAPIEHGICNDRGENAILTAIRYDQPGCVSDMCMYEIATRLKDGSTPLHFAAAMESLKSIVLMHGALKRARDSAGMTSFELACSLGKTESVKKLIELGSHISKHDAARAIKIAKDHGFQNIADYIASFDFPDIDPSVITASMRLLQSSKVSSKALTLVAEMSAQEKANVIMSHSKVMTESFKNEVIPPMEGLSESMRLAQQKVCQVVNRYEIDKKKKVMEDFVSNIDELAFEREKEKPPSEEEVLAARAAERRAEEQREADSIQRRLAENAAERSRKAAERLALAEQAAAEREIELLKASASRMEALSAMLPADGPADENPESPSPLLPVTLAQLTAYPPSADAKGAVENTLRASALDESIEGTAGSVGAGAATQDEVDVDDIINQISTAGVVNDAYEAYSSDDEGPGQTGDSVFHANQRVGYTVPEGVEHYGSGESADNGVCGRVDAKLSAEEIEREHEELRRKRQDIQERNRAFHEKEDVIDSSNPFPLIGVPVEKHVPFPSVSSHEKLDPLLIVPRQYTPKTDAKGRPLHERINHSSSPSRSILVTTQGGIPPDPNATMGPAQIQGILPADYYGIRLYCTCPECTAKLTEIACQLHAKDKRIAALQNALEETRAFAAACVNQMQECTNCYQMKNLKTAGYTDESILINTATNTAHLVTSASPGGIYVQGNPNAFMANSITANRFTGTVRSATLKLEEHGFIPRAADRLLFPRAHEDVLGFHAPPTQSRNSDFTKESSTRKTSTVKSPSRTLGFSQSLTRANLGSPTMGSSTSMNSVHHTGHKINSDTPLRGATSLIDYDVSPFRNKTELMLAAKGGNITEVQRLLDTQRGEVDGCGRTALMYAAEYGHLECVKSLLEHEDCVADRDGMTALMYAASFGHLACVKVLAEKEASFKRPQDGATALMAACANGFDEVVSVLLPLEKRTQTIDGRTALMIACQNSHLPCVMKMLPDEHDQVTATGRDALSYARESGNALVIHEVEKVFRQAQHLI